MDPFRGLKLRYLESVRDRQPVVLGYHGVSTCPLRCDPQRLHIAPDLFRSQLELLLEAGFRFVTLSAFVAAVGDAQPPAGLAAVTFDDGFRNNLHVAMPILRSLGVPATVYVTVGFLGGFSPWIRRGGDGEMLREDELRDLVGAGWEIGTHTMSHADLVELDEPSCRAEIKDSREALEALSGAEVNSLAYPYGHYDTRVAMIARDLGLGSAVTTGSSKWSRYELNRTMMSRLDPFPIFLMKLTDRYSQLLARQPLKGIKTASKALRSLVYHAPPPGR
ncbi:MAG: polysaccharide deacetylase family protein [Solirubrobacteraceae bacterium]